MDSRRKYIRISCVVAGILLVVITALWFMGVITWGHGVGDVTRYVETDESEEYVVYDGMLTDDESLKEYVDSYAKNDHAMPQDCGSKEMDGRVFYYYSYFTQNWCDDGSVIVEYNFKAYCDIGEGQIYTISAHSYTNSDVMDTDTYLECMKLDIKLNIK